MWLTGREVEGQLQITYGQRAKLKDTGVLQPSATAGRSDLYESSAVQEIANRPEAQLAAPAIAVRLSSPQPAKDESPNKRRWRGWSEDWDAETKANAARMWWQVGAPENLHGGLLVAVVANIVVGAWRIIGHEKFDYVCFEVTSEESAKDACGQKLTGTALRLGRARLTAVW